MSELKYKRILLKVSGEALGEKTAAGDGFGLDFAKINAVCESIKACVDMGVQVGLVIGGGNFWRGVKNGSGKLQRSHADAMGMLATVMNAIAVADALEEHGMDARVLTAVEIHKFAEYFTRDTANRYLNEGKVVIFAGGTGNPYFTTDMAAALRAAEMEADLILLAKNVDGIYDSDPKINPNAKKYDEISYLDFISNGLQAMDTTAVTLCMENSIPILAFGLSEDNGIMRAVKGEKIGTIIK